MAATQRETRHITAVVLRWYYECDVGVISCRHGQVFDVRLLNYRVDVERVMAAQLSTAEQHALTFRHRDGLSIRDAVTLAHLHTDRPDTLIAAIESRLGRALLREGLNDISTYFTKERTPCEHSSS